MNIILPSRLTLWRFLFTLIGVLSCLAASEVLGSLPGKGVELAASPAWIGLIALLGVTGLVSWLLLAATWSRYGERLLSLAEFPDRVKGGFAWMGIGLVTAAVTGFTVFFML